MPGNPAGVPGGGDEGAVKTMLVALNAGTCVNLGLRQIMCCLGESILYEANINALPPGAGAHRRAPRRRGLFHHLECGMVWRLCRALKRALPGVVLFAGGPETSGIPPPLLPATPWTTCCRGGAGDGAFSGRPGRGRDPAACPGVSRREAGCPPVAPAAHVPGTGPTYGPMGAWRDWKGAILYVEPPGLSYHCRYCLSGGAGGSHTAEGGPSKALRHGGGAKLIKLVDRTFHYDRRRAARITKEGLIRHSARTGTRPAITSRSAPICWTRGLPGAGPCPRRAVPVRGRDQSANERALALSGRPSFEALRIPWCA